MDGDVSTAKEGGKKKTRGREEKNKEKIVQLHAKQQTTTGTWGHTQAMAAA
jgi:hypothetical protein